MTDPFGLHLLRYGARHLGVLALGAALALGLLLAPAWAQSKNVVVFAAASLRDALDEIDKQYQVDTDKHLITSLAASSMLAKQIEVGAPADVFISADLDWMDYLAQRNLIKPETRKNMVGNELVLIAPKDSAIQTTIEPNFPLTALLAGGRLAMADTKAVPAGKYGRAALEKLGVWEAVSGQIAQAENVRAALALVTRKEAPLGIVYRTDAAAEPGVKIVAVFPADTHPAIIYPIAVTARSTNPDAIGLVTYLTSPKAATLFEKQGFTVLK
jgi:molybdate transport system substrate-binding protein